uniref:Uncharacterized protein n=1 Tax=Mycobacterium riyadhense TaxID=486698 RepID=A0A653F4F8_9MYCO|nr:hypothetical protein BIN_B_05557 [Mycobacterium riyadhense]
MALKESIAGYTMGAPASDQSSGWPTRLAGGLRYKSLAAILPALIGTHPVASFQDAREV